MHYNEAMLKLLIYKLKRFFHFFKTGLLEGVPAELTAGFPARKLKIIVITGTDGKTTSSTITYSILKAAGFKVGLITTVAAYVNDLSVDTGFHVTAPTPKLLQKLLKQMVDAGCTHVVLEMTSHGAYQYRNWGIKPYLAGLTNIAREHLDYHLNYHQYVLAKLLLLNSAQTAILNADDASYRYLDDLDLLTPRMETYSRADQLPEVIETAITKRFKETYNRMNARLATALALRLGVDPEAIAAGIKAYAGVPGRMEVIAEKPVRVIVDFAHTPQAVESVLTALKAQYRRGRLIAVHGCAGLRDTQKRSEMGRLSSTIADLAIFTAEDPRTEDVWSIIRQMKEQLTTTHAKVVTIADRGEAVRRAITEYAAAGDTVVILGKGHEQSMCFGTTETPWSDREAARAAVAELVGTTRRTQRQS